MVLITSFAIVTVWMLLIQTVRYIDHYKKHDGDPEDSPSYMLATKPHAVYWIVPMAFVFIAACGGQLITHYVTTHVGCLNAGVIAPIASMMLYMVMDLQKGQNSLISKVCNSIYYLMCERKLVSEPDTEKFKKRLEDMYNELEKLRKGN